MGKLVAPKKPSKNNFRIVFLPVLIGLIGSGIFCSSVYIFATSSGTPLVNRPYDPGEILNPNCEPGSSAYCTVAAPEIQSNRFQPDGYPGLDEDGNLVGIFIPRSFTSAEISSVALEPGELSFTSDTYQMYVGNSEGVPVGLAVNAVPYTGAISDIDLNGKDLFTTGYGQFDGGILSTGTTTSFTLPSGAGTRMMWIPDKRAFRAGVISGTQWDSDNIGDYSVAFGYSTTASGYYSTALGLGSTASGDGSTVMGYYSTASGTASFAAGSSTTASGEYSFVLGDSTTASGLASTASGSSTTASGDYSTASGGYSTASALASTASGYFAKASGSFSTASGYFLTASGEGSFSVGHNDNYDETFFVAGTGTADVGYGQIAMGYASSGKTLKATGTGSVAMGQDVNATTNNNVLVFGNNFTATTANSFNIGFGQLDYQFTAAAADFKDSSLTTTGIITGGTLVTGVESTSPSGACTNGSIKISSSVSTPGIYYCYGGAWHYSDQTSGFQIPSYESIDPVTGEQMAVGDFVVPMIDKVSEDGTAHGVWAKWSTVKSLLLSELSVSTSGGYLGVGTVSTVETDTTPITEKVTNVLTSLGISISNGITSVAKLTVEKSTTDIARINKMEMVDSETGEIYCTWISNGEWKKVLGECGSTEVAAAESSSTEETAIAVAEAALDAAQSAAESAATAESAAQAATVLDIVSVSPMSDIEVDFGSQPQLPQTVEVVLSDGIIAQPAVVWVEGTPPFDPNTSGTYIFTGTINTASSITNSQGLTANVNVIVNPEVIEIETQQNETPTESNTEETGIEGISLMGDLISSATASLISSVWEFVRRIFNFVGNGI